MKQSYNIQDVAKWLLSKQSMSPKKLQKMLYYEYSWFLVLFNDSSDDLSQRLFDDTFEAWVHGPVNYEIYTEYKENGYHEIEQVHENMDKKFEPDVLDSLNEVFNIYSKYNGGELERLTHSEDPWKNARKNCKPLDRSDKKISDSDIYNFYYNLINP